VGEKKNDLEWV